MQAMTHYVHLFTQSLKRRRSASLNRRHDAWRFLYSVFRKFLCFVLSFVLTLPFPTSLNFTSNQVAYAFANPPVAEGFSHRIIEGTRNSVQNLIPLRASDADGDPLIFTIQSLPGKGHLETQDGTPIDSVPYDLPNSNRLKYVPNVGATAGSADRFTFTAYDGFSDSNVALVTIDIVEWFPPIGIPEVDSAGLPLFGIHETHWMYETGEFVKNKNLVYYQDGDNGPYTHYVDRTRCAIGIGPIGTFDNPLCSIPSTLSEGSVVEVHGENYSLNVQGTGAPQMPIFVRGGQYAFKASHYEYHTHCGQFLHDSGKFII